MNGGRCMTGFRRKAAWLWMVTANMCDTCHHHLSERRGTWLPLSTQPCHGWMIAVHRKGNQREAKQKKRKQRCKHDGRETTHWWTKKAGEVYFQELRRKPSVHKLLSTYEAFSPWVITCICSNGFVCTFKHTYMCQCITPFILWLLLKFPMGGGGIL